MDFISVCNNWFEFGLYLTRFPHYREMSWRHWYLQHLWVGSVEEEHCLYWLHLTWMLSCVFWSWVNLARAPLAMLPDITSTGSFLFLLTAKKAKDNMSLLLFLFYSLFLLQVCWLYPGNAEADCSADDGWSLTGSHMVHTHLPDRTYSPTVHSR